MPATAELLMSGEFDLCKKGVQKIKRAGPSHKHHPKVRVSSPHATISPTGEAGAG